MTENIPAPPDSSEDTDVIHAEPADTRAWLIVSDVLAKFREPGINTIIEACKQAGFSRYAYYRALKKPYVHQQLQSERQSRMAQALELANSNWYRLMSSQYQIALDPDNRNAVAAARWIRDVVHDAEAQLGDEDVGESTADFIRQFASMPGQKQAKVTVKEGKTEVTVKGELTEAQ